MDALLNAILLDASLSDVKRILKDGANANTQLARGDAMLVTAVSEPTLNWLLDRESALIRPWKDYYQAFASMRIQIRNDPGRVAILKRILELLQTGDASSYPNGLIRDLTAGVGADPRFWLRQYTQRWDGVSALQLAIDLERTDLAVHLIECGADPNMRWNGFTPLQRAARMGNYLVVSALLSVGTSVDAEHGGDSDEWAGFSAISFSAQAGHHEVVSLLVAKGAKLTTSSDFSPLMLASMNGHSDTVMVLCKAGAKADATSLHLAVAGQHEQAVSALLAAGADPRMIGPRVKNHFFYAPPIVDAARNGCVEIVRALLAAGADPNAKDSNGYRPITYARRMKHADLLALLRPMSRLSFSPREFLFGRGLI